jgi:osmotically-inducible protein OsmY
MPILLSLLISLPAFAENDRLSMEQAKEKAKQTGAEAKRATKNAALTGKVKSALAADVGLKTAKIDVGSEDGVVTLKGNVDSRDTRRRVEATAKKVSGVSEVRNELQARN